MSTCKRYPKITFQAWKSGSRRQCQATDCDTPSSFRIEIQQTYMRGDDDVFWLCEKHNSAALTSSMVVEEQCRYVYKLTGNYKEQANESR
jgi:hypothetical protein